jgi:hypothetical protein
MRGVRARDCDHRAGPGSVIASVAKGKLPPASSECWIVAEALAGFAPSA